MAEPVDELRRLRRCPRCGTDVTMPKGADAVCPHCGLVFPGSVVAELDYLDDLDAWVVARRGWLEHRLVAEPAPEAGGPPFDQRPAEPPRTSRVGQVLLAAGAIALVAAAIAFTAVAWGSLGAVGRFAVLIAVGSIAYGIAVLLASRVRATATALAVVGGLLIAVATTFLLGTDGPGGAGRAAVAAVIGVVSVAACRPLARRLRAAAVVTGVVGAVLLLGAAISLSSPDALDIDQASWTAVCLLAWGTALTLAHRADRTVPWSYLGAAGLVAGVLSTTAALTERERVIDLGRAADIVGLVLVLVAGALLMLLLDRLAPPPSRALVAGSCTLLAFGALAAVGAAGPPQARVFAAVALAIVALAIVAWAAHVGRLRRVGPARWMPVRFIALWVAGALVAAAIGIALAAAPRLPQSAGAICSFAGECRASGSLVAWAADAYPWWRGLLTAVVALGLSALATVAVRRRAWLGRGLPVALALVALATWLLQVTASTTAGGTLAPEASAAFPWSTIGVALTVAGAGLIAWIAAAHLVPGHVWIGGATALLGVVALWQDWGVEGALTSEIHGVLLAAPLLLAGMTHLLLVEPDPPTTVSVMPALIAVLLPPTLSVLDDTASRWFTAAFGGDAEPATGPLLRSLLLLIVAALLAVVGGRQGWAGVFWPGLAVLMLLVAAQLVDAATLIPDWIVLAAVGAALVLAGARWEWIARNRRRTGAWLASLH